MTGLNNEYADNNGEGPIESERSIYSAGFSNGSYESDSKIIQGSSNVIKATIEHENNKGFAPGTRPSTNGLKSDKDRKEAKYRSVKVGKRMFEIEDYSEINDNDHFTKTLSQEVLRKNDEWPIAENVFRRKRNPSPESVVSLPMSSMTAFSAFTKASSSSTVKPKRSKFRLIMNSLAMFGREFCYAIEAGLTTPILLSIGLPINLYSIVWAISPFLGFVLQPIIGNMSDSCKCAWGRRRPFILGLAILVVIGMTLFLNGEQLVHYFGEMQGVEPSSLVLSTILVTILGVVLFDFAADFIEGPIRAYAMDVCDEDDVKVALYFQALFTGFGGAFGYASGGIAWTRDTPLRRWFPTDRQVVYVFAAVSFIICIVFNLFSIAEKNRSKKRKIASGSQIEEKQSLLSNKNNRKRRKQRNDGNNNTDLSDKKRNSVTISNDGSKYGRVKKSKKNMKLLKVSKAELIYGTFTVHNGVPYYIKNGCAMPITEMPQKNVPQARGYQNSNVTEGEEYVADSRTMKWIVEDDRRKRIDGYYDAEGQQREYSDSEVSSISDEEQNNNNNDVNKKSSYQNDEYYNLPICDEDPGNHYIAKKSGKNIGRSSTSKSQQKKKSPQKKMGLKDLFVSIKTMPRELKTLCVCHLLGWMAFLCVVLFFTDYVGQEVYEGDPRAAPGTEEGINYGLGVEMGNIGMTVNAAASALYCFMLKSFIRLAGPRMAYMFGYLAFGVGAALMVVIKSPYAIVGLSSLIGVMSGTLYTLPYFLVAQYHEDYKKLKGTSEERGIGVDCALVTCMIQLAQIIVGLGIGALVVAIGSVSVTLISGSAIAFAGAIWACFLVKY